MCKIPTPVLYGHIDSIIPKDFLTMLRATQCSFKTIHIIFETNYQHEVENIKNKAIRDLQ